MKTKHIKITNRPAKQLRCILAAFITWLLPALTFIVTTESSLAASATWVGGLVMDRENDWNATVGTELFRTNWDLAQDIPPPNGPRDTATFEVSSFTSVFLSANTEVDGIVFQRNENGNASAFTISVGVNSQGVGLTLNISGVGITNTSGLIQTLEADPGGTLFTGESTGGTARVVVSGTGSLDISSHGISFVTIGSIEGNGEVFLGTNSLNVGSNNLSTLFSGVIQDDSDVGGGSLTKVGTGTLTLSGPNTYDGPTFILGGTLSVGSLNSVSGGTASSNLGAPTTVANGTIELGGTLLYTGTGETTDRIIELSGFTGGGTIDQSGTGLLKFTNGIEASSDLSVMVTLQGSSPAGTGEIAGAISDPLPSSIGGPSTTSVTKSGTGTWTLSGKNTYTGTTTINAGTLLVDGSLAADSAVTVNSGATLGGTGTAAGAVAIADGGILAPGDSPGTLTVGSISFSSGSLLNYELGTPGVIGSAVNDLTHVTGAALTLDGILNTTKLTGFGPGAYRLFDYDGALTDNTLDIGTVPTGFQASNFIIVTGLPKEVDLLVLAEPNQAVQFWDGLDTQGGNGIDGGTGSWDNFMTNWTGATMGAPNTSWRNDVAAFAGTFGTVTVTQPIFFTGLEFMTDGYQIDLGVEGSLNLIGSPTITTDTGIATITATLDGAGGIIKDGPGTLILTGTNTYFGSTTINAGILSISSDGNLGTLPEATVADQLTFDGGTLQATASFALNAKRGITLMAGDGTIGVTGLNVLTYGGVIGGAGSLTKDDTGTLELSAANIYAGATTVKKGILKAGVANTLPAQTALSVDTGATFDLNNSAQSIGSLAGAGSVTLGTATLTTGNDNTSTDFAGIISGSGGLTKMGSGIQTLSGGNIYAGATAVNGGTLSISSDMNLGKAPVGPVPDQLTFNGGTLQATASVDLNPNRGITLLADGGTIGVTDVNALSYGGVITGPGSVTKINTGTLDLLGANTYTGTTTVNAGTLLVDGTLAAASAVTVNAGGTVGGTGTVGGSLVNSGIVSPGNSPGMLTIAGNYTQMKEGTLRIEVAGPPDYEHDLLVVKGTATLAGTLQIIRLGNFQLQPGSQIIFLTAEGGVSGTFKPVENPFLLTSIDSTSIPNSVVLEVLAVSEPPPFVSIQNIGVSLANIQTVNLERRMDDIRAGSKGFSASGFTIKGDTPNYIGGLAGPTGPEGKSGPSVMQPAPDNRWGVFVNGLGEFTDVDSTSNASGYDLTTGGLTLGVDYRVSPNFAIGLTGGYAHTNAGLANNGSLDVNGGKIGLYATVFGGGFYLDTAVTGGFDGYDTSRTALQGTARGSTSGGEFNALVAGGYDWKKGGLSIGPIASFQYTYVGFDAFTENGSVAPLSFNSQNADSIRTALGFKTSYEWKVGGVLLKPELRASWQHEFGDTDPAIAAQLASGAGNSFTVNGPAIGRDSLLVGAGVAVLWNDRVSTYAYYDGELARTNYISNNVTAGIRVNF